MLVLVLLVVAGIRLEAAQQIYFCCAPTNDLYLALGGRLPRSESPERAVAKASRNSAILLLADDYPNRRVIVPAGLWDEAARKRLRIFLEFPESVPGLAFEEPQGGTWERIVVASPEIKALPQLSIMSAHSCKFLPVINSPVESPLLVLARVAGYDRAVFGLPDKNVAPLIFRTRENGLVATTKLSGFVTGRFAPKESWSNLWIYILHELAPDAKFQLKPQYAVATMYGKHERLPEAFQRRAFSSAAEWFAKSGLFVSPSERDKIHKDLLAGLEVAEPVLNPTTADGRLGVLEGYSSAIQPDGRQLRRLALRADCNAETAMVLALDGRINRHGARCVIASNLLDYVFFDSGMCKGARADPKHGAYGLIGWGDVAPSWSIANYGDDNARTLFATLVASAGLQQTDWDGPVMRALLANLRTTGKLGFRGDRIDLPALEAQGWKPFWKASPVNYSPHFEAYLWAAYLWAYARTGYDPFLERSRTAITMTMKVYPEGWRWRDNLERAHMLLPLAWLVRVEDTPEHRQWLQKVATDLLKAQEPCGAIRECIGPAHGGHYQAPLRNEDYGTGETPLVQENGDPVADQLYTTGFALLGLHEAAGATGDPELKSAEDRLAEFLCRSQIKARAHPWLQGSWFRAFDFRRWEAWASSADVGWGAWSLESGWGQAWIAATLGLRELKTTVWDFTAGSKVAEHMKTEREALGLPAQ